MKEKQNKQNSMANHWTFKPKDNRPKGKKGWGKKGGKEGEREGGGKEEKKDVCYLRDCIGHVKEESYFI